jgi:ribulose-phosphate 3-epimerase
MKCPVVPACIPNSREAVIEFTEQASFTDEIQIDVVDGQFVENVSWPYVPMGEPKSIKHATDPYTLEVDLMVQKPISAAQEWIEAGADMLVFHVESVALEAFKNFAADCAVSIGVAFHGDTLLETFMEYVAHADYVQLMGIKKIGVQGEGFDERVLETIAQIKERFPSMMVSVDGSVNTDTIDRLREAGADRFVSGSAILGAPDPRLAHTELCARVN